MNIESHSLTSAIAAPEAALRGWLGVDALPANAMPPKLFDVSQDSRVIVPTARTTLGANETFTVRALVLSSSDCESGVVAIHARPMGSAVDFAAHPMAQVVRGRCVFELDPAVAAQAPFSDDDFEWWVSANLTAPIAKIASFPARADSVAGVWMTTVRAQY